MYFPQIQRPEVSIEGLVNKIVINAEVKGRGTGFWWFLV